jgi:hypothetical protein
LGEGLSITRSWESFMISVRVWMAAVAVLAATMWSATGFATPTGTSISINFGADEPNGARSDVTGAAGIAGTQNWNNLSTLAGTDVALTMDQMGVVAPSTATVSWESAGTWSSTGRGEENNTAPAGNDRNLMTGYLDTSNTSVTTVHVKGLDSVVTTPEYAVAVYIQGGVNGRGGQYTVATESQVSTLSLVTDAAFSGTYVPGGEAGANYLVFTGFTDPEFTLTATPTDGGGTLRAPINAIEIVAIPEPSTMMLLGLGMLGITGLGLRKR